MKIKLKYLNTEFLKYSEVLNKNFGNNGKL